MPRIEIDPPRAAANEERGFSGPGHREPFVAAGTGTCHRRCRHGHRRRPAVACEMRLFANGTTIGKGVPHAHALTRARPPLAFVFTLARPARAQTWFDANQSRLEDRFADGDIDVEDLARTPAMGRRQRSAGSDVLAQTWVSLVGFSRGLPSGLTDVGGFVVVGLALDKIAHGATFTRTPARPSRRDPLRIRGGNRRRTPRNPRAPPPSPRSSRRASRSTQRSRAERSGRRGASRGSK